MQAGLVDAQEWQVAVTPVAPPVYFLRRWDDNVVIPNAVCVDGIKTGSPLLGPESGQAQLRCEGCKLCAGAPDVVLDLDKAEPNKIESAIEPAMLSKAIQALKSGGILCFMRKGVPGHAQYDKDTNTVTISNWSGPVNQFVRNVAPELNGCRRKHAHDAKDLCICKSPRRQTAARNRGG